MKIQKRKVNSQDHTLGYKIGGKWYTRKQAVSLAKKGKVSNVSVCGKGSTQHLRGARGFSLYGLKTQMV
jgi:hypothetical protein